MGEMIRYGDVPHAATGAITRFVSSSPPPPSSSERRYIEFLDTFQTVFVQPLAAAEPDNAVLAKLARDLATVLLVSRQLLEEMEAEDARGRFAARAAEILDTWAPLLRSYKDYVTGAMRAKEEHVALQASSRRYQKALAATVEKNAARLLGQDFDSLLSMPVQRVPRLELLAANLLKATPLGAPTRAPLERAHATIQRTARHLNESFGRQDAREALAALQTRLAPLPAPLPPLALVAPGRDLVLEADFGLSALDLGDCDAAALRDAGAAPRLDVLQVRAGRIPGGDRLEPGSLPFLRCSASAPSCGQRASSGRAPASCLCAPSCSLTRCCLRCRGQKSWRPCAAGVPRVQRPASRPRPTSSSRGCPSARPSSSLCRALRVRRTWPGGRSASSSRCCRSRSSPSRAMARRSEGGAPCGASHSAPPLIPLPASTRRGGVPS